MAKPGKGCLRPEEKQEIQIKKNELIRNAILCVKNFNLSKEEIDQIIKMIITLTYHRVSAYLDRIDELNEKMLMLRGIYSKHVSETQQAQAAQQTAQQQMQAPQPQQNNFINQYNDWQ